MLNIIISQRKNRLRYECTNRWATLKKTSFWIIWGKILLYWIPKNRWISNQNPSQNSYKYYVCQKLKGFNRYISQTKTHVMAMQYKWLTIVVIEPIRLMVFCTFSCASGPLKNKSGTMRQMPHGHVLPAVEPYQNRRDYCTIENYF